MKYILLLLLSRGTAPVTPEHYMLTTAEFDDVQACRAVITALRQNAVSRVTAFCFAKGSAPTTVGAGPTTSESQPGADAK